MKRNAIGLNSVLLLLLSILSTMAMADAQTSETIVGDCTVPTLKKGEILGVLPGTTGQITLLCPESAAKDPKSFACDCREPMMGIPAQCRKYRCNIKGISSTAPASWKGTPSFDCMKAQTQSEKLICSDEGLGSLDQKSASLFLKLSHSVKKKELIQLRDAQRKWIEARDLCGSKVIDKENVPEGTNKSVTLPFVEDRRQDAVTCIRNISELRISELQNSSNGKTIPTVADISGLEMVFRSTKYGFEIRFPKNMRTSEDFSGSYLVSAGGWRQANSSVKGTPVVSIVPDGNEGTIQSTVAVRIGVHAGKTSEEACDWNSEMEPYGVRIGSETIDAHSFQIFDISNGGMGHSVEGRSYQTFYNGYCFAIERFIASTRSEDEDSDKKSSPDQGPKFYKKTDAIIRSFRFLR